MFTSPRSNYQPSQRLRLSLALVLALSMVAVPVIPSSCTTDASTSLLGKATLSSSTFSEPAAEASARTPEAYGKLSLQFEANHGQTDEQVRFLARGSGYTLFLTATDAVFELRNSDCESRNEDHPLRSLRTGALDSEANPQSAICTPQSTVLRMKVEGANSAAEALGEDQLPGIVNYLIGNDSEKWHTNIPTFARVCYAETYPGVDLVYYGNQMQLEYDFVVAPGADSRQVSLSFEGADSVEVEATTGDLLLRVGEQIVRQHKPFVYQEVNGDRNEIGSGYVLKGAGRVGFRVGAYDRAKPLVIDPVLVYSTYLGGSGTDAGNGIAVDSAGNAYVTGVTDSINFPTANPIQPSNAGGNHDVFVTKLNAAGTARVYSTYLGGDGDDVGGGIAVDSAGNSYITGSTDSTNFIAPSFGNDDVFVVKLNATGSALVHSTIINANGVDAGYGIAVDPDGNAYITGSTASTDFLIRHAIQPGSGGGVDAFMVKLNASLTDVVYSTYLGGGDEDKGRGIAADADGNAYVTGSTKSDPFPTYNPFQPGYGGGIDAFVAKLNAAGTAHVYSTYLGGSGFDEGLGIAVDPAGNAYVTGQTSSIHFPTANPIQPSRSGVLTDAFVTKLNASGSALAYSTYLGGGDEDIGRGIAVDSAGNAYVTGQTSSSSFPTTNPIQLSLAGTSDAFVTRFNASGSAHVYSTYLGGSGSQSGNGIAVDSSSNTYLTGLTSSLEFPRANPIQPVSGGGVDAFVSKIGSLVISGRVTDAGGNGIADVAIILNGTDSAITQTDSGGNFQFIIANPGGSYTVTPVKQGFAFTPESQSITNLNSNRNLLFVGTQTGGTPTPTPTPIPGLARVQFEFDNYIAAEDCGGVEVAVIRTGDTASAFSIDFATADGTAKQKGDYGITLGTISFAPGDTRKLITVLVTEDAFSEGDESFSVNLFNPSGTATLEEPSRTTVTIADDDPSGTNINPIEDTHTFVCQHYHDFFNREPDTSGLLFWINNIDSCGANPSCRAAKRIDTSAAFFLSIEFQGTGFYAIRLQRTAFGKRSDTATTRMTYQDLVRDTRQLGEGVVVGQAGADTQLEQNKQAYATEVVASAAFIDRFPLSQTAAQFVDALYASAQVTPTATERNDAITAFGGGETAGRVAALRKVAESESIVSAELNAAFVLLQYHGYLRRNPTDLPDTDDSGYQFWLGKLNSFGGDFRAAEMVKAFLSSAEYRQRFGPS